MLRLPKAGLQTIAFTLLCAFLLSPASAPIPLLAQSPDKSEANIQKARRDLIKLLSNAPVLEGSPYNRMIAFVNGAPITVETLYAEAKLSEMKKGNFCFRRPGKRDVHFGVFKLTEQVLSNALSQLVDNSLMYLEAQAMGTARPTDAEIEDQIAAIAKSNALAKDEYLLMIARCGLPLAHFKQDIAFQIARPRLMAVVNYNNGGKDQSDAEILFKTHMRSLLHDADILYRIPNAIGGHTAKKK